MSTTEIRKEMGMILVVEDEVVVRRVLAEMLHRLGHEVLTAEDGSVALELFKQRHDDIALVLFDMTMPTMDGADLFESLIDCDPTVKTVMTSGFNTLVTLDDMLSKGLSGFLPKPFSIQQVRDEIARVLA